MGRSADRRRPEFGAPDDMQRLCSAWPFFSNEFTALPPSLATSFLVRSIGECFCLPFEVYSIVQERAKDEYEFVLPWLFEHCGYNDDDDYDRIRQEEEDNDDDETRSHAGSVAAGAGKRTRVEVGARLGRRAGNSVGKGVGRIAEEGGTGIGEPARLNRVWVCYQE